jgi:hypothetical protein
MQSLNIELLKFLLMSILLKVVSYTSDRALLDLLLFLLNGFIAPISANLLLKRSTLSMFIIYDLCTLTNLSSIGHFERFHRRKN